MTRDSANVVYVLRAPSKADIVETLDRLMPTPSSVENVLVKPNWIKEKHLLDDSHRQVITQSEVLDPVLDWVDTRMPKASATLADAPETGADIVKILERSGVTASMERRASGRWRVEDLRLAGYTERNGVPVSRRELRGDSRGGVCVQLGSLSSFVGHGRKNYYGSDYHSAETNEHHHDLTHDYMFSGTALSSDLVINVPKLKTHKKAGVTISLKNLVGLNGNKNWLPHYSIGTASQNGDAYDEATLTRRLESSMLRHLKSWAKSSLLGAQLFRVGKVGASRVFGDTQRVVRSGNWHGNDTIWRMILDLNRILIYAHGDGTLDSAPQRRTISVVDGVVGGEGNGPEAPDPVPSGIVVLGTSFGAVDLVCAKLMGFDWKKIPHLRHLFDFSELPLVSFDYEDIRVVSNVPSWDRSLDEIRAADCMRFRPHFGWLGHIELPE